ncbi:SUMO-activating enzyme E1 Uba2 subunit [Enterocytozoon bieneusi H348]|nr:SUMO-activating enzyme E1 Uba2 subunit [Enterocytozoon bieneusi H348]|eukprot:XP_001828118.1 SUMO-activating enzyme E1 Uba2 subunit [Enterocytozoon bieneusi H348]
MQNKNITDERAKINCLVVGCGGIGTELIKLLLNISQFYITVVDYDNIDITNLNRQFFFTKNDINKSKSKTVGIKCKIKYLSKRIQDINTIYFYSTFDVVFNCLDNNETRSYVNQRCYLLGINLIDGGSGGWFGQVYNFNKLENVSKECFDCIHFKETRIFPVCTVKNNPRDFKDCLVWAKMIVENSTTNVLLDEISKLGIKIVNNDKSISINNIGIYLKIYLKKLYSTLFFVNKNENYNNYTIHQNEMPIWSKELLLPHNQLKLIYYLATIKANQFNLQILNYLDSTTFIQNVIPSISTTNSSIASLMIHSFYLNTNYYYTHKIYPVKLADKNPECIVCGVPNYICRFTSKATLGDLLNKFNMDELIVNNKIINLLNNNQLLYSFNYKFGMVDFKGLQSRIYFEIKKAKYNGKILLYRVR